MTYDSEKHESPFPFEQGYADFHSGIPRSANRYLHERFKGTLWTDGWDSAERLAAAKREEAECGK